MAKNFLERAGVTDKGTPGYNSWINQMLSDGIARSDAEYIADSYVEAKNIANADPYFNAFLYLGLFDENYIEILDAYKENKLQFYKQNAPGIYQAIALEAPELAQGFTNTLISSGVPQEEVKKDIDQGLGQAKQAAQILAKWTAFEQRGSGFEKFAPIIATFVAPILAPSVAAALSVSTSTASAIVGAAVQVASGIDPQAAIQNAITNAVVQTGSSAVASEINATLNKAFSDELTKKVINEISDAAGSALASGAKAAIAGGSQDDIIKSALSGAVGSVTTRETGEAVLGSAVAGGIAGGFQGALAGAAGAIGRETDFGTQEPSAPEVATPTETPATPAEGAVSAATPGATPETVPGAEGTPELVITAPKYTPEITTPPTTGDISKAPPTRDQQIIDLITPPAEVPEVTVTAPKYTPEITTPPDTTSAATTTPAASAPAPAVTELPEVTVTAPKYQPEITTPPDTTPEVVVTGKREEVPEVVVTAPRYEPEITTPPDETFDATEREGTLAKETPATDQYTPSIKTSYTVSAKPRAAPTSTLAQVLQGQYYPLSTTGLTAYRPAGEIESEESGKGRQDVWNEASLRLKDALGL